jgi:hypothetical protein
MEVKLIASPRVSKKYRMIFYDGNTIVGFTDFGSAGMSDFLKHKDEDRKERWLKRFNKLIDKTKSDPTSAMTLSHLILWNKPTLEASYRDYKKIFNLKKK